MAYLAAGKHTLRLERASFIPHIAALALRHDPSLQADTALEQLPPEAFVGDDFPLQDWMIWAIGGIQEYTVREGGFAIRNGQHSFNRPLYGPPGAILPVAGDKPQWLLAEINRYRLGILSLAVGDRWLHRRQSGRYDAGRMGTPFKTPPSPAIPLDHHAAPSGIPGFHPAVDCRASGGGAVGFWQPEGVSRRWAGAGGWGVPHRDAAGNRVELRDGGAFSPRRDRRPGGGRGRDR